MYGVPLNGPEAAWGLCCHWTSYGSRTKVLLLYKDHRIVSYDLWWYVQFQIYVVHINATDREHLWIDTLYFLQEIQKQTNAFIPIPFVQQVQYRIGSFRNHQLLYNKNQFLKMELFYKKHFSYEWTRQVTLRCSVAFQYYWLFKVTNIEPS